MLPIPPFFAVSSQAQKNQRTPCRLLVSVLLGTVCTSNMVEAAGIEPASASTPPLALHAYPILLV